MAGLFGGTKNTQQPAAALRITTSLQGIPLPWLLGGQQRLPGNLIWYGSFNAVKAGSGSAGGKGGLFGGGGATSGYNYFASFILAACEGPDIESEVALWVNGVQYLTSEFGIAEFFPGDYAQDIWPAGASIGVANYYRGLAYAAFFNYPLGGSPGLPQINIELLSTNSGVLAGQPDGDPSACWTKFFTDPLRGLGFPTARMGSLTSWQQYCIATGMLVSPALASAVTASSFANDLLKATNSNARWSAGLLTVVPYGDQQITAGALTTVPEEHLVGVGSGSYDTIGVEFAAQWVSDGGVVYTGSGIPLVKVGGGTAPTIGQYAVNSLITGPGQYLFNALDAGQDVTITYTYAAVASYTPNVTPIYALTLDNFLPNQGTIGQGVAINNSPLIVVRKPRDQMLNVVKVTYLDRTNSYNPVTIEVKNEASLQAYGRWRADSPKQYDFFCLAAAAQQSAALALQREQIARTFQFTLSKAFILLDVMDLVEVSDPAQVIVNQAVRITEIQENEDFSLTFTAEEFLGTAAAPLYNIQANNGFVPGFNTAPGNANLPILFEPTDELGGGLFVWAAVSGQDPATWGGCNVWVSSDGTTYQQVETILGAARMGVTTADFPSVAVNATGQTIDQTNTLSVDLTESQGSLSSGTVLDATSLNTACYVGPINGGGEIVAYETATLTATYKYVLTYLVRGAYGTEAEIVDHPSGSSFARLDSLIAKIPFNQSQIGSTIYVKFQGFNQYQGGLQELSECAAYTYTITGSALASPLPDVEGLYSNYQYGFQQVFWDEVEDFRSGIVYEIRQGASWQTALPIRTQAHPPFIAQGNGTFQIMARCQPVAGLIVYSETASEIIIAGNQLSLNLLAGFDEKATGWTGAFQNGIGIDSGNLRLGGAGNILTDANVLTTPDILDYGSIIVDTPVYYTIPADHIVNAGSVVQASVNATTQIIGVPVGANVLGVADILSDPDVLGSASTQFVDGWIEIAVSQDGSTWGAWQKFVPGVYPGMAWNFRIALETTSASIIAYALAFNFAIQIPSRIDHYQNQSVGSGGLTITFERDGVATPAPFNGGPNLNSVPYVSVSWQATAGDTYVITGLSLSQLTIQFFNSSSPVARTGVNIDVEGF